MKQDSTMAKKTNKEIAAERLNRRAGQYERHGQKSIAILLRDAAKRLLGIKERKDNENNS